MRLFLFTCALLASLTARAQSVSLQQFDFPLNVSITDMVQDDVGNLYFAAFHLASNFDSSMSLLIKTDPAFHLLWAKRYKVLRNDDLKTLTLLKDGNLLLGGTGRQNFALETGGSLIKVDTSGAVIWHKVYDGTYDDRVMNIFEQPDSSLMVFIRYGVSNRPTRILHLSSTGEIQNQRNYSIGTVGVFAETVVQDSMGRFFMAGDAFDGNDGERNIFVASLSTNSLLWYKEFSFPKAADAFQMTVATDGDILLAGYTFSDTLLNKWDALLMKFTPDGTVKWANRIVQPAPYNNYFSGLYPLPDGQVLAVGTNRGFTSADATAMQIDSSGNIVWARSYTPEVQQSAIRGLVRPDGRLVIISNTTTTPILTIASDSGFVPCHSAPVSMSHTPLTFTTLSLSPDADDPGLAATTPPLTVSDLSGSVQEICSGNVSLESAVDMPIRVFPNPAVRQISVTGTRPFIRPSATLIDLAGHRIPLTMIFSRSDQIELQLPALPSSTYWLEIRDQEGVTGEQIVIR